MPIFGIRTATAVNGKTKRVNYAAGAFYSLFSLVRLAILLRPSVRAAFARQGRVPPPPGSP